jgi:membrane protease YdiL (CAAX protease family)
MDSTPRRARFTAGFAPVVGVVAFVSLVATLSVVAHLVVLGPETSEYPRHVSAVLSLPFMVIIVLGTYGILRYEGVSATDVGLCRSTLFPGVVAFGLFWAWVTVAGVGYLVATGATGELGFSFEMPWYWVPVWFLLMLTLSNGLTEEFVFRGYLQSKCTALAPSRSRGLSVAVGILSAAILFGVPHVPRGLILEGASPAAIPWIILNGLVPGVIFGLLYYLTRNVWFVGFVHGFGNATVVPFDPSAVPGFTPFAALSGVVIGIGYRYRNELLAASRVPVPRDRKG